MVATVLATRPARSAVVTTASAAPAPRAAPAVNRRALGLALGGVLSAATTLVPRRAEAILLDEDDEDMIAAAKANRRARLAQQKDVAKEFNKTEGFKSGELEKELVPVQAGVYKLAKVGSQLEAGDLKAASSTMSESWVSALAPAAAAVSTSAKSKASMDAVISSVSGLAKAKDLSSAKSAYVTTVSALSTWATDANVDGLLKGL